MAHNCPYCGNMQGDGFIVHRFPNWESFVVAAEVPGPIDLALLKQPHSCDDIGRGLCSQRALQPRMKSLKGRVSPDSLADLYDPLPPKDPDRWKNRPPSRSQQIGSHRRQPPKPATPEPPLARDSTSLDHVFEARWAVLEPRCAKRPRRRLFDSNIPIPEMTRVQLWQELDIAVLDLEAGRVETLSAQRRSEGRPDNLREILGEFFPE